MTGVTCLITIANLGSFKSVSLNQLFSMKNGTYSLEDQRLLRRDCAYAQSRLSNRCSHTKCMNVDACSGQTLNMKPG